MSRYLEETVKLEERTEELAKEQIQAFRDQAKKEGFTIKKAGYEYKTKKSKGVIIDERWVVTCTKTYATLWDDLEAAEE